MYGVPFENPTDHWVHQPTSEGPTDTEHFFTDDKGKSVSKKPPGRTHQRDVESVATVALLDIRATGAEVGGWTKGRCCGADAMIAMWVTYR